MTELEETAAEIRRLVDGAVSESRLNPVTACLLYDRIMQVVAQSLAAAEERGRLAGLAEAAEISSDHATGCETARGQWTAEAVERKIRARQEEPAPGRAGEERG